MTLAGPSARRDRGRRAAALVLALVAAVFAAPGHGADAQEAASAGVSLTLSGFSGVIGPGSVAPPPAAPGEKPDLPEAATDLTIRALVSHTGGEPLDQLRLVVEVHPAAGSRAGLRATLDRGETPTGLPTVHGVDIRPDSDLHAGEIAGVELQLPAEEMSWNERGGVHPVRITVQRGTEVLAGVTTAVVWLSETPEEPVNTAALWPLDTPPLRGPGPAYPADVDTALRPGGRMDALLRALEEVPDARITVAPATHLLEDLRDRADGFVRTERLDGGALESRQVEPEAIEARLANDVLQRIRAVISELPNPPIVQPYADADLAALTGDPELQDLAGELATTGRRRLQRLVERSPDPSAFLLPASTSEDVLDLIPAEVALVPYTAVEGPNPVADPTLPSPLRSVRAASGRPFTLLVGDPYITDLLDDPPAGGTTLITQRILAETAMVYFESPGNSGRTLAIYPPESWSPSTDLATSLLESLASAVWLELNAPDTVATRGTTPARAILADPAAPSLTTEQTGRLASALRDLEAAAEARPADPQLDGRDPSELRDQLLRSTSAWFPAGSGEADALVTDVRRAIDATLADVRIASGSLVTLTSDTGTIPVTLQRGEGGPLSVQVEVASQGRLSWPEGRRSQVIELAEGTTQTVSFQTEALSTGTFSVSVRVTDPSGRLELDRTTLSVRSTSISGPALSVIAGLVVVLLLAGVVRRRPRRRLELVR